MVTKERKESELTRQVSSTAGQTAIPLLVDTPQPTLSCLVQPADRNKHSQIAHPRSIQGNRRLTFRASSTSSRSHGSQNVQTLNSVPPPHKSTQSISEGQRPFSQGQLALALSISKSRPEELSTLGACALVGAERSDINQNIVNNFANISKRVTILWYRNIAMLTVHTSGKTNIITFTKRRNH
jgi:hypothetical protein